MVQTHGSVQLSMGAATIKGMINVDMVFDLRLLPEADGKPQPLAKTLVKEIFSMMELHGKKVWIRLSTGTNGTTTAYFLSVIEEIREHMAAFILCQAAQVYWWLQCRGCLTEDINRLIPHCFTLSQQQKVTKSKYVKDAGHVIIDQTDADDIINAATTQGIYDLTLGLSDKERRTIVTGKAHEASVITYREARGGLMEAHNFLSAASITSIHTRNKKKRDTSSVATAKSLAKSVFSIGTTTSKDTEGEMEESKEEEYSKSKQIKSNQEQVTISSIGMLHSDKNKAMLLKTGETDKGMTGSDSNKKESSKSKESEFKESADEMRRAGAALIARMEEASFDLADTESEEDSHNTPDPLSEDEEGKDYKVDNSDAKSNDDELNMSD
jgi:hypothetical protein